MAVQEKIRAIRSAVQLAIKSNNELAANDWNQAPRVQAWIATYTGTCQHIDKILAAIDDELKGEVQS